MHDRVSVHSICFPTAGMEELGRNWRTLGARRVSFSSGQVLQAGSEAVRTMLRAGGHQAETVTHVFCNGPLAPRSADMHAERAALSEAIAAAASIGARSIYMLTGGRGAMNWEDAAAAFAAAIAPCLAEAKAANVALAIENTTPFYAHAHLGNTLQDTILLAEIAGVGVCIDVFACWTEAGLHAHIERAMKRCLLVQVSDYVLGDRALPCRAVPGDGAIPWPLLMRWLRDAGYAGTFDLELIGPRIDQEGQVAAARRAAEYVGKLLEER